ncbi:MAG: lamin tail domain-containing protein [Chloroflexia bacterium]
MKILSPHHWRPLTMLLLVLILGYIGVPVQPARSDPFVDPAFTALWQRTDQPVAGHLAMRSWTWGPAPGAAKQESYAEGVNGVRVVQYFDKGRMEINNPNGDRGAPFFVTGGLLTVELISGLLQTGDSRFEARSPANIPIAGDRDDTSAPTYASFAGVSSLPGSEHPAASAVGGSVSLGIAQDGKTAPFPPAPSYGVTYAYFEAQTKHNVADPFWRFLNSAGPVIENGQLVQGPLYKPWFAQAGLPISEAYWAQVKITGRHTDVLIQAFQRRVLTYVPTNEPAWQVEMGNIGLHYQEWRYAIVPPPPPVGTPLPPTVQPLAQVAITGIVTGKSGLDLNEQTVSLVNNGDSPVVMTGWTLVSPKNDHIDTYTFPQGFVLGAGAHLTVHAGQGYDSPDTLYMRRYTWLFDATGFDGVILYNGAGREVSRYFLQGGALPTQPPLPLVTPTAASGEATATPTVLPAASPTALPSVTGTPETTTPTSTPNGTMTPTPNGTPTPTPTGSTATPTATATATPRPAVR